jgi:PhoPQ-activated pathogenicity-related protein
MFITVPKNLLKNQSAFFFIGDGYNNRPDVSDNRTQAFENMSASCNCVTVTMKQVPNQPTKFKLDPSATNKIEDQIIAMTYNLFTNARHLFPNDTYKNLPLLIPMVKAVKRGMDIVQEFLKTQNVEVPNRFVLSGASKRGWTAWLATAIDDRVTAAVPLVFDIIRFNNIVHNNFMSLNGSYSFALYDYYSVNMTRTLDSEEFYEFAKIVDTFCK